MSLQEQFASEQHREPQKQRPPRWEVVLLDDDETPMEWVIFLLMHEFDHGPEAAERIMLMVHNEGEGVAGLYSKDIARSKAMLGTALSREEGHPLKLIARPQGDRK